MMTEYNRQIVDEQMLWLSKVISLNPFSECGLIFTVHGGKITGIKRLENVKLKFRSKL